MPFKSDKQRAFMFQNHPEIAQSWVDEAEAKGESPTQPDKKKDEDSDKDNKKSGWCIY